MIGMVGNYVSKTKIEQRVKTEIKPICSISIVSIVFISTQKKIIKKMYQFFIQ